MSGKPYLYALSLRPGALRGMEGLGNEPLRALKLGPLHALFGELPRAPEATDQALFAHAQVVEALATRAAALLPARFGLSFADREELALKLEADAKLYLAALRQVRGAVQYTLRVMGDRVRRAPAPPKSGKGPGTRYLAHRRALRAFAQSAPELEALVPKLRGLVKEQRVRRHDLPPLLVSVYHLVPHRLEARYTAAVQAAPLPNGLTLELRGPFPPYAFAPETEP